MSILTGPPRETATSFSAGSRSIIPAESGASWVTMISAPPMKLHHIVGLAEIFLQPVKPIDGVAMLHRLVGPGGLDSADVMRNSAGRFDLFLEDGREHEAVADDGNFFHDSALRVAAICFQTGRSA